MWGHPLALQREPMWWLSVVVVLLWVAGLTALVTMVVTAFSHQTGRLQTRQTVVAEGAIRTKEAAAVGVVAVVVQTITIPQEAPILVRELDTAGAAVSPPRDGMAVAVVVRMPPPTTGSMRVQATRVEANTEQQTITAQV